MRFLKSLVVYRPDEPAAGGAAAVEPPATAAAGDGGDGAGRTLMADLLKERTKRKDAEKALADANAKVTASEQAQLSENEQLKAKLAAAEATTADLTAKAAKATKASLVRSAAKDFHDPEDAVALLDTRGLLADIEDASDAATAVKALATDRPHLVKAPAAGGGQPDIQQILRDGLGVEQQAGNGNAGAADDGKNWTHAELRAMSPAQMAEVMEKQRPKLERSLASLKA